MEAKLAPVHTTATLRLADEDLNYEDIYYTVFSLPAKLLAPLLGREKNPRRVIITIEEKGQIHSGLMPDGKGDYFVTISKQVRTQYDLKLGEPVDLKIDPDDSDYGMPLPLEVSELWATDREAKQVFHQLTPGKQRGLLYQIAKPKASATRIKKALQIHDYLKMVQGRLDYKELTAYIKADNANR